MSLRVYNTLTKTKELFEPVRPGKVGIYVCGPTVYKPPHTGHVVGPIIFDAIKRYLQFKGFEVTWVVNITDVDDKLINEAAEQKTTVAAIAEKCTREYFECLAMMGIDSIDKFPKASEHVQEIIDMVTRLIERGHAYVAADTVYFDVSSDADYGKLSHQNVADQEAGTRAIESTGKKNAADFALWKLAKPGEPAWDSPWGKGRPGWHIECSAMATKYLGNTIDFHGGGMDLIFPHHENELAQSECATGQTFVKFWLHNGLTRVPTKVAGGELHMEKASKSLGNVIDARQFIENNGGDLLRYLILTTHYRSQIDFKDEVVSACRKGLATFARLFERVQRITGEATPENGADIDSVAGALLESDIGNFARAMLNFKMKFMEMMDDDFNTAGAIAVLHEIASEINSFIEHSSVERDKAVDVVTAVAASAVTLRRMGGVLGLFRKTSARTESRDTALASGLMELMIRLRAEARITKNFSLADSIRKGLTDLGITLEDRSDGTFWRRD